MDDTKKIGNKAFRAGLWYVVSSVVVKMVTVITTPIFTRLLSHQEYGTVQTFTSWRTLLLPIFSLNLAYSIGRAKLDFPGRTDEYIGSMQVLSAIFSLALAGIILLFLNPFANFLALTVSETVLLIIYLVFETAILFHQAGYRYHYLYKENIVITWYMILATTGLSLLLIVVFGGDLAFQRLLGTVIPPVALSLYFWGKSFRKKMLCFKVQYWKYGLAISVPLILHNISLHILAQSDRIFITKIWGKADTAFYSLAYTYGMLLQVFSQAVAEGWLPWFHDTYFSGRQARIRESVKPLIVLGCFVSLAAVAFAPEAVLILGGRKYAQSIPCVPPVVMGVTCQFIYTHYVNIEMHLKKTAYVSAGTIIAAGFNIVTNAIFIPRYGYTAAAYTTLASYFLLLVIHFVITRRLFHVHLYDDWFLFGSLIATGIIIAILTQTYDYTAVRYGFILAGFLAFLFYFRDYIGRLAGKYLRRR